MFKKISFAVLVSLFVCDGVFSAPSIRQLGTSVPSNSAQKTTGVARAASKSATTAPTTATASTPKKTTAETPSNTSKDDSRASATAQTARLYGLPYYYSGGGRSTNSNANNNSSLQNQLTNLQQQVNDLPDKSYVNTQVSQLRQEAANAITSALKNYPTNESLNRALLDIQASASNVDTEQLGTMMDAKIADYNYTIKNYINNKVEERPTTKIMETAIANAVMDRMTSPQVNSAIDTRFGAYLDNINEKIQLKVDSATLDMAKKSDIDDAITAYDSTVDRKIETVSAQLAQNDNGAIGTAIRNALSDYDVNVNDKINSAIGNISTMSDGKVRTIVADELGKFNVEVNDSIANQTRNFVTKSELATNLNQQEVYINDRLNDLAGTIVNTNVINRAIEDKLSAFSADINDKFNNFSRNFATPADLSATELSINASVNEKLKNQKDSILGTVNTNLGNYYKRSEIDEMFSAANFGSSSALDNYYTIAQTESKLNALKEQIIGITQDKLTKSYMTAAETTEKLNAAKEQIRSSLDANMYNNFFDKTQVATKIAEAVQEVNTTTNEKLGNYYTKDQTRTLINDLTGGSFGAGEVNQAISNYLTNYYTKTAMNEILEPYATKAFVRGHVADQLSEYLQNNQSASAATQTAIQQALQQALKEYPDEDEVEKIAEDVAEDVVEDTLQTKDFADKSYVASLIAGVQVGQLDQSVVEAAINNAIGNEYAKKQFVTQQINQLSIPTNTSDLYNDSGFITNSALSLYAKKSEVGDSIQLQTDVAALKNNLDINGKWMASRISGLGPMATLSANQINLSGFNNDAGFFNSSSTIPVNNISGLGPFATKTSLTVDDLPNNIPASKIAGYNNNQPDGASEYFDAYGVIVDSSLPTTLKTNAANGNTAYGYFNNGILKEDALPSDFKNKATHGDTAYGYFNDGVLKDGALPSDLKNKATHGDTVYGYFDDGVLKEDALPSDFKNKATHGDTAYGYFNDGILKDGALPETLKTNASHGNTVYGYFTGDGNTLPVNKISGLGELATKAESDLNFATTGDIQTQMANIKFGVDGDNVVYSVDNWATQHILTSKSDFGGTQGENIQLKEEGGYVKWAATGPNPQWQNLYKISDYVPEVDEQTIANLGFIKENALDDYVKSSELGDYVKSSELGDYVKSSELGDLAYQSKITPDQINGSIAQSQVQDLTNALNGKQDTIDDLATIKSNASAGAAVATNFTNNVINTNALPTIPQSKIENLSTTLSGKQDTISNLSTIVSNAANGNTAYGYFSNNVIKDDALPSNIKGLPNAVSTLQGKFDSNGKLDSDYLPNSSSDMITKMTQLIDALKNGDYIKVDEDTGEISLKVAADQRP